MKKNILAICLVLIVIGSLFCQEGIIKQVIDTTSFIQEFKDHEVKANVKYVGKRVTLTGKCDEFSMSVDPRIMDGLNYGYVPEIQIYKINGDYWKGAVLLYFSNDQKVEIASLDIGSLIKITGTVYKSNGPYVLLVDCVLLEK